MEGRRKGRKVREDGVEEEGGRGRREEGRGRENGYWKRGGEGKERQKRRELMKLLYNLLHS